MENMYFDYLRESYGTNALRNEYGFVTYLIKKEEIALIDIYIIPEDRKQGHGLSLLESIENIGRKNDVKFVTAQITLNNRLHNISLQGALKHGFKISSASNYAILLYKEIV